MTHRAKTKIGTINEPSSVWGEKEREGACGHSFDAPVPSPGNQPVSNKSTRYLYANHSARLSRNVSNFCR